MGTPGYNYDQQALMQQIHKAYIDGSTTVVCDCSETLPDPIDLDTVYAELCTLPVDAQMDPETFEITLHAFGYQFDLDAAKAAVAAAEYGAVLEFPFTVTAPEKLLSDVSSILFRDVLSTYNSYQASNSNRATNMQIACKAINGTILLPGEVFDFNKIVGERTPEKGYKTAPSYSGAETVLTYGGGICQPSSTIYYCALMADMEIVERACHTYASAYVTYGMDATVNWGTLNFRFRNSSEYPIRIDATADNKGNVKITIMGTDTKDYYVKMTYETVDGPNEGKTVYQDFKWNNKEGYKDGEVIQTAYTGRTVKSYRQKYDKATEKLISSTYEATSRYKSRDKIIARVEPKPTEPPETVPTPTPAPIPTEPPATTAPAPNPNNGT